MGCSDSVTMETANLEIRFGVTQLEIWRRSRKQRESNSCKSLRRQSLNSRTNPRIHPENLRENNHTSSRRFRFRYRTPNAQERIVGPFWLQRGGERGQSQKV